jgi:hypothetical protein
VYDTTIGKPRVYDKGWGKTADIAHVKRGLCSFFYDGRRLRRDALDYTLERLQKVCPMMLLYIDLWRELMS